MPIWELIFTKGYNLIKVKKLSKNYGDVKAVKSISFEIKTGEVVGFLGANGAGKSTTLKMITGFLTPTSGNIYINGLNIKDSLLDIQKNIGYLPELNPLYTEMKVYDLLEFTANIRKISGGVGVERIFPFNLPTIQKIEVNGRGKVRRSRIFYFRELRGKKARIKERKN